MFSITGVVNKQEIDDLLDAMAHIVYRKKWYDYVILSNLLIVICFPIGLYAIWRTERIALWWKVSSTVLVILIFSAIFGPYDSAEYTPPQYSEEQAHQDLSLQYHQQIYNQCELNYWTLDQGHDEWILFLHGAGADHRMFMGQAKELSEYFNLILLDGRGQGKSRMLSNEVIHFQDMVQDVIAILDELQNNNTHLVAQSLGASLAQEVTYYYPDRVHKLVLIGCYNQHSETSTLWMIRNYLMTMITKVVPWNVLADRFGQMTSENQRIQEYTTLALINTGRATWENLGLSAYDTKHVVDKYSHPHQTLLMRGENDYPEMLSPIYKQMKETNPLSEEVIIKNAGHVCNMENVYEVNRAIKSFLQTNQNQKTDIYE